VRSWSAKKHSDPITWTSANLSTTSPSCIGRYAEVEPFYKRALAINVKVLG
jgi:hypothetical protein